MSREKKEKNDNSYLVDDGLLGGLGDYIGHVQGLGADAETEGQLEL